MLTIEEINLLPLERFTEVFGGVFEKSPWVAAETWGRRPFASAGHLREELTRTLMEAGAGRRMGVIRAHPDLAGRLAAAGKLTAESTREQAAAGLGGLSEEERGKFASYNAAYVEKFGFPFIICARLNDKGAILGAFERRLGRSREEEEGTALEEIGKIAALRLADIVRNP